MELDQSFSGVSRISDVTVSNAAAKSCNFGSISHHTSCKPRKILSKRREILNAEQSIEQTTLRRQSILEFDQRFGSVGGVCYIGLSYS